MSLVLHGANRYAGLISVKGAAPVALEHKATGVVPRCRAGQPIVVPCSVCSRPAAGVVRGGLRSVDGGRTSP